MGQLWLRLTAGRYTHVNLEHFISEIYIFFYASNLPALATSSMAVCLILSARWRLPVCLPSSARWLLPVCLPSSARWHFPVYLHQPGDTSLFVYLHQPDDTSLFTFITLVTLSCLPSSARWHFPVCLPSSARWLFPVYLHHPGDTFLFTFISQMTLPCLFTFISQVTLPLFTFISQVTLPCLPSSARWHFPVYLHQPGDTSLFTFISQMTLPCLPSSARWHFPPGARWWGGCSADRWGDRSWVVHGSGDQQHLPGPHPLPEDALPRVDTAAGVSCAASLPDTWLFTVFFFSPWDDRITHKNN